MIVGSGKAEVNPFDVAAMFDTGNGLTDEKVRTMMTDADDD